MVVFRDKHASIGRVKPVSHDKTIIPATSPSRSLESLIRSKQIQIEIRDNGYLIFDFSSIIGTKIKVNATNAKKLAEWITKIYERRTQASNKTELARKVQSS
jgi:hypothetical protein